jgi:hypothetical protein
MKKGGKSRQQKKSFSVPIQQIHITKNAAPQFRQYRKKVDPLAMAKERQYDNPKCTEPVKAITVPADSERGALLYATEISPTKLGRLLKAKATQAQSWAGNLEFQFRVNGSVNAKNYAIARVLPDADLTDLPAEGEELWRYVRASTEGYSNKKRKLEDRNWIKYNVISNQVSKVKAPWTMSFNPLKPVTDSNATERSLGLLVVVSNGPPGESIVIDVDCDYDIYLCGPTPRSTVVDLTATVNGTPTSLTTPFATYTSVGPGHPNVDPAVITLQPGSYSLTTIWTGTGITGNPPLEYYSVGGNISNQAQSHSTTKATNVAVMSSTSSIRLTYGAIPATNITTVVLLVAQIDNNV